MRTRKVTQKSPAKPSRRELEQRIEAARLDLSDLFEYERGTAAFYRFLMRTQPEQHHGAMRDAAEMRAVAYAEALAALKRHGLVTGRKP